jgi:hypothetical protein
MNRVHGVKADEFKRAAGFNISTGVVAKPLAQAYSKRQLVGIALDPYETALQLAAAAQIKNPIRYNSHEAKEHLVKAAALRSITPGPTKICRGCNKKFQQKTTSGKALYCSFECRDFTYEKIRREKTKQRVRQQDGTFKWIEPNKQET